MKRVVIAVAMAAAFAVTHATFGQGQDRAQAQGNPFIDHSDNGETVHVLPPEASIHSPRDSQPTFAPVSDRTAVFSPSYGSGTLIDHGGLEIPDAAFYAIYWNSTVANSNSTSLGYATLQAQLTAFITSFPKNADYSGSSTDDYEVIQQYGSHDPIANTLGNWGVLVDSQPTQSRITDGGIRNYLASLFNSQQVLPSGSTIYGVYLPSGMRVALQGGGSCTSFCGYHGSFNYGGIQINTPHSPTSTAGLAR